MRDHLIDDEPFFKFAMCCKSLLCACAFDIHKLILLDERLTTMQQRITHPRH